MPFRVIARLDIKGRNLIKGRHFEGLRVVGDPHEYAVRYAEAGADELLFMDTVASLYGRNQLTDLLERTTEGVFIPVTVGGGIRSLADIKRVFDAGADRVAVNTAAIRNPKLVAEIAQKYGSQAITVSIEAKRIGDRWEAYTDNGRERTGRDAVEWALEAQELGAGEVLLTSIDQEGTGKGLDLELALAVSDLDIPVVIAGGVGSMFHVEQARKVADGVAVAFALHYGKISLDLLQKSNICCRNATI